MKRLTFVILCCITFNLYALDISALQIEYMELLEDIRAYGPQPTIPYYVNLQHYNSSDKYVVDVDNDFVFAIIGSGFLKFVDTQGNVRYTRYLWLNKDSEGRFYGLHGTCADEFYETNIGDRFYLVTAYLPLPGANVERDYMTIEMDEVIAVDRMVESRKLNTSMIDLVYTVNRMMEILYILKQLQCESSSIYEFKIRTLEVLLNLVIEDRYEFDKECRNRILNNQQITQIDFYEMHPHIELINEMLPFLELER